MIATPMAQARIECCVKTLTQDIGAGSRHPADLTIGPTAVTPDGIVTLSMGTTVPNSGRTGLQGHPVLQPTPGRGSATTYHYRLVGRPLANECGRAMNPSARHAILR